MGGTQAEAGVAVEVLMEEQEIVGLLTTGIRLVSVLVCFEQRDQALCQVVGDLPQGEGAARAGGVLDS